MSDTTVDDGRLRIVPHVSRLRYGAQEGPEAGAALVLKLGLERDGMRVVEIRVVERRRADETFVAALSRRQVRKVMEDENPVTAAVREDLEAPAVRRERVGPHGPRVRGRGRCGAEPVLLGSRDVW